MRSGGGLTNLDARRAVRHACTADARRAAGSDAATPVTPRCQGATGGSAPGRRPRRAPLRHTATHCSVRARARARACARMRVKRLVAPRPGKQGLKISQAGMHRTGMPCMRAVSSTSRPRWSTQCCHTESRRGRRPSPHALAVLERVRVVRHPALLLCARLALCPGSVLAAWWGRPRRGGFPVSCSPVPRAMCGVHGKRFLSRASLESQNYCNIGFLRPREEPTGPIPRTRPSPPHPLERAASAPGCPCRQPGRRGARRCIARTVPSRRCPTGSAGSRCRSRRRRRGLCRRRGRAGCARWWRPTS